VYQCDSCLYRSDVQGETALHVLQSHGGSVEGSGRGYASSAEVVRGDKLLWCLCVVCHAHSCASEAEMEVHFDHAHSGQAPHYVMLNNKGQRVTRQLGHVDTPSGSLRLHAVRPSLVKREDTPSESTQATPTLPRPKYVCPVAECGVKTKTLKGIEEHLRQNHVTRMRCADCQNVSIYRLRKVASFRVIDVFFKMLLEFSN
jgi:hypothetical protein